MPLPVQLRWQLVLKNIRLNHNTVFTRTHHFNINKRALIRTFFTDEGLVVILVFMTQRTVALTRRRVL